MTAYHDQALALRITGFNRGAFGGLSGLPFPGGEFDVVTGELTFGGSPITEVVAATVGLSTAPDDTPANTVIPGSLTDGLNYGTTLFSELDPSSPSTATAGVLTLNDPAGELDDLLEYALDGATATLLRGDPRSPLSSWSIIATFTTAGMTYDTRQKKLRTRDLAWRLNTSELLSDRYTGAGGIDGDSTLTNRYKPWALGQNFNVLPVLIAPALLIYQVSVGSVNAITAVRDGGIDLPLDTAVGTSGDCASYAALAAASITSGKYATCKALGIFRLGGSPARPKVTCDVQGDADTIGGVGYVNTVSAIARRIAIGRGDVKLTTSELDEASFIDLATALPATVGWYFDGSSPVSKARALDVVLKGCLGWWYTGIDGLLHVGVLDEPSGTGDFTLIWPFDFVGEPAMQSYASPRQATYVGYSRNWTPQTQSDLAAGVSQTDAVLYSEPMRTRGVTSIGVQTSWPTAPIVTTDAGIASSTDAASEAARQQRILGVLRERWTVTVRMDPTTAILGSTVTVSGWPRYSFLPSRTFICVGLSVTGRNQVTLDLWG